MLRLLPLFILLIAVPATAQPGAPARAEKVERSSKSPLGALSNLSIFGKNFNTRNVVEIVDLTEPEHQAPAEQASSAPANNPSTVTPAPQPSDRPSLGNLRYVSDNPADTEVLPPDETPSVRVNPDAPGCFKALMSAKRSGDRVMAQKYAAQCIRYQQHYFFEIREIVQLFGRAMIDQNVIDEDDWVGVSQMLDRELAQTRLELGDILKPTHDVAMQRIEPDKKNQVEIYYFFTMSCSWCRYMASDIERLWRITKDDPNVKMTLLTIDSPTPDWLEEYRRYTGLTAPVLGGAELARHFGIGFVPAVVVLAPNTNRAYLKTGQQSFERLYEFTRTVQGLPATVTAEFKRLQATPIGQAEEMKESEGRGAVYVQRENSGLRRVSMPAGSRARPKKEVIERF